MIRFSSAAAVALALAASLPAPLPARAADLAAGKAKARACVNCHGLDGLSRQPDAPNIAGQIEMYLIEQLRAFRDGERRNPQMTVIAKPLSDADIENLAAWYSAVEITVTPPE